MNGNIDIELTFRCKLRTKRPMTVSEELAISQEEMRINYYLDHLAYKLEKEIKLGKKIDSYFIERDEIIKKYEGDV